MDKTEDEQDGRDPEAGETSSGSSTGGDTKSDRRSAETPYSPRLGDVGGPKAQWVHGQRVSYDGIREKLESMKSMVEAQLDEKKKELHKYQRARNAYKK